MFHKIIAHFKMWNRWRKCSYNSVFHKLLVLFRLRHSPTFQFMPSTTSLFETSDAYDKLSNSIVEVSEAFAKLGVSIQAAIDADKAAREEVVKCLKERSDSSEPHGSI